MTLTEEALKLDQEAEQIISRSGPDFVRIGRIMHQMTDDMQRWRLLVNPTTNQEYSSQEEWVTLRFKHQRSTAFAARSTYRALYKNVPDCVLESSDPGSLKVLAELPESVQRSPEIHELAMRSTAGEFTEEALKRYPNELIEKRINWTLRPTISQAARFDEVIADKQRAFAEYGTVLSREDTLEYLLTDMDAVPSQTAKVEPEPDWSIFHG